MFDYRGIEKSQQAIPLTPEVVEGVAKSIPLHALGNDAPAIDLTGLDPIPRYPISNDESAPYFEQTQARTLSTEYRESTNRTAVVIGESSLMAALPYIPEETIVLVDSLPEMVAFMGRYVDALREADTMEEWIARMGLVDVMPGSDEGRVIKRLIQQGTEWKETGYLHPAADDKAYAEAHRLAKQKAIIPWRGNITSRSDMNALAEALRDHDATVTMLNLSNVIACSDEFRDAAGYARVLQALPITPNAPILATTGVVAGLNPPRPNNIVEAVGPYFGLENLKQHGGRSTGRLRDLGSIITRHYHESSTGSLPGQYGFMDALGIALADMGPIQPPKGFDLSNMEIVEIGVEVDGDGQVRPIDVSTLPPEILQALRDTLS